jgi:hypothetical protein
MDVATPGELVPAIESVAKTVGLIMNMMLKGTTTSGNSVSGNDTKTTSANSDTVQDTTDDPCLAIPLIDQINADKPGVVEYETDIGDSCKNQSCFCS